MEIDNRPLVSVIMAVYKPNERWFREQLCSLNEQTYPALELIICDDCPDFPVNKKIISETVDNFPFTLVRNEKNVGSNRTFERLTRLANGKYISYCDQDDVWHADKVRKMYDVIRSTGSPMVCCDLNIIDGEGNMIADSITKVRKRHIFREGEGLAPGLLVSNFVTGCAMMMKADTAKRAVPFVDSLVHDQWLAICAALEGRIEVIRESLIDYRQHEGNQTGILKGVYDKNSYYNERLTKFLPRLDDYKNRLYSGDMKRTIDELCAFYHARIRYSRKMNFKDLRIMLKYKRYSKTGVLVETAMKFIPAPIFKKIISLAKNGKI